MKKQRNQLKTGKNKAPQAAVSATKTNRWPEDPEAENYIKETGGSGGKSGKKAGRLAEEAPAPKK